MAHSILVYKCRSCGHTYDHPIKGEHSKMHQNFASLVKRGTPFRGSVGRPRSLLEIHQCDSVTQGVAECISLVRDPGSGSDSGS